MKRVMITGAKSYIGESLKEYMMAFPDKYDVQIKRTLGWTPSVVDFKDIDVVVNVAGIAHVKEIKKNQYLYYDINRDLAVNIANMAKKAGVNQYILLSTMSVYGMVTGHITKDTPINPINAYGKSKAEADMLIEEIADKNFKFACLRPPMVYGFGCKGNYPKLRSFALKTFIFPNYNNKRSMIYIGNLCEFIMDIIDKKRYGLFFPQNEEYVNTSIMVDKIARLHGKNMMLTRFFNWLIKRCNLKVVKKVFGDLTYEKVDLVKKYDFDESIKLTEGR